VQLGSTNQCTAKTFRLWVSILNCVFLQRVAEDEKRGQANRGIVSASLVAAALAVLLLLASQFVGL
jgi:hypothetical protein